MTLNTHIAIRSFAPHTPREIFMFCRTLIDTPPEVPIEDETPRGNVKAISHPLGVGLDGWLRVRYGADGPLTHVHDDFCATEVGWAKWDLPKRRYRVTQEEIDEHTADVAADPRENGWATVIVSLDTAYSFMNERGESCSDRHARFVAELGTWLDKLGMEWKWQNEYTCEWHDRYEGLSDFGNFHMSEGGPAEWFAGTVLPAIRAGLSEEGQ